MFIEYKNVNIQQNGTPVLSGVDFHADEGEFIYIIGHVGSGKSSLLKTMYCELDIEAADGKTAKAKSKAAGTDGGADGGEADGATVAGVLGRDLLRIRRKDIPALRREMGIIFQDFQLLHDRTVFKNLEFVLRATGWKGKSGIGERIAEVLDMVGMADKADKMPSELSGGEQQRIAIARAILNKPKVIIADEPTGNLDPETADSIVGLLKQISATGAAVVMSTHNIPMLDKYPGIVYCCKDGRLTDITGSYNKLCVDEEND